MAQHGDPAWSSRGSDCWRGSSARGGPVGAVFAKRISCLADYGLRVWVPGECECAWASVEDGIRQPGWTQWINDALLRMGRVSMTGCVRCTASIALQTSSRPTSAEVTTPSAARMTAADTVWHQLHRQLVRQLAAHQHRRHFRHASCRPYVPAIYADEVSREARGQGDGGDLRLVAHLGQEEGDLPSSRTRRAPGLGAPSSSSLSGISIQPAIATNDRPRIQRSAYRADDAGQPGAKRACGGMVERRSSTKMPSTMGTGRFEAGVRA